MMQYWDTSLECRNIAVPTLVINGIDEAASGDAVKPFLEGIPDVRGITLQGSTHSPHWEVREVYMKIVADFLTRG